MRSGMREYALRVAALCMLGGEAFSSNGLSWSAVLPCALSLLLCQGKRMVVRKIKV